MREKFIFRLCISGVFVLLFLIFILNAQAEETILKVWDFNEGIINSRGGFYNTFNEIDRFIYHLEKLVENREKYM